MEMFLQDKPKVEKQTENGHILSLYFAEHTSAPQAA
jgi:hypothetical protein